MNFKSGIPCKLNEWDNFLDLNCTEFHNVYYEIQFLGYV